ncbi:MAG: esterase/lipase family protein, partial [Nakamurella sp.]
MNQTGCHSSRPPVVLLHGTASTPASNFTPLAARLLASGRCVFAVLYGSVLGLGGLGDIDASARRVSTFIGQVRSTTRAPKVDVIAFSQGALVLRDALQGQLDPATVRVAVLLAPNYHGTTVSLAGKVPAGICPACSEQVTGSALLRRLAAGGELSGSVRYATLSTRQDTWVLPIADQSPRGPADRVRSQLLQDSCPTATVGHIDLPAAPAA